MTGMLGKRWGRARVLLATAVVLGMAVLHAPGSEATTTTTTTFRYVAADGYSDLVQPLTTVETPAGYLAPLGTMRFRATGTRFTLTVDDVAALPGQTVPVYLHRAGKAYFLCLADSKTYGFWSEPGMAITVEVTFGPWRTLSLDCASAGSAGTVTVTR